MECGALTKIMVTLEFSDDQVQRARTVDWAEWIIGAADRLQVSWALLMPKRSPIWKMGWISGLSKSHARQQRSALSRSMQTIGPRLPPPAPSPPPSCAAAEAEEGLIMHSASLPPGPSNRCGLLPE